MRALLPVLGFFGFLLTTIPDVTYGGPFLARTGRLGLQYGQRHQGRKSASGERFSMGQLTVAHRFLSLGTKVKVMNLRTGQHVVVRINDGGPSGGGKGRIIDLGLSEAAAKRVGSFSVPRPSGEAPNGGRSWSSRMRLKLHRTRG